MDILTVWEILHCKSDQERAHTRTHTLLLAMCTNKTHCVSTMKMRKPKLWESHSECTMSEREITWIRRTQREKDWHSQTKPAENEKKNRTHTHIFLSLIFFSSEMFPAFLFGGIIWIRVYAWACTVHIRKFQCKSIVKLFSKHKHIHTHARIIYERMI